MPEKGLSTIITILVYDTGTVIESGIKIKAVGESEPVISNRSKLDLLSPLYY